MNAAEAGDEARVARHDFPEREIGQLEVDRLLGKAGEPRFLRPSGELCRLAPDADAHQREWISPAVVTLADREGDARIALHVLRMPGKPAHMDVEGREICLRHVEGHRRHWRAVAQRAEVRDALAANQASEKAAA